MERFLSALGRGADPIDEVIAALGPVPAEANLGFVYASDQLAGKLPRVMERLQQAAPGVHWVGTLGLGVCATGVEVYEEPALAVMVGDFPEESFRLLPSITDDLEQVSAELGPWLEQQELCFGLLHGDPANQKTPAIIEQLAKEAAPVTFLNGGLTSSNLSNYQVLDGEIISGGVSGVLFGAQVAVATDHTQGCLPIGPAHQITEAERNVVATLDHRPALEVMKEEIGEEMSKDLQKIAGKIFAGLPVPGSDTGDYLVRHLMGLDTRNGWVAVGDYMSGHEQLLFCQRDGDTAREDLRRMLDRLKGRIGNRTIRGGIYVTCLGRGREQFDEESEELRTLTEALGEFPLVGFFANGELYNGRLYGYTGVLTLFLG